MTSDKFKIEKRFPGVEFKAKFELGVSIANLKAIANLSITRKAIILERLLNHGRVDKRASELVRAYIADHRVKFTQAECDHAVWVMGHLLDADDVDKDSAMGAMIMMKYCIDGCCEEIRDKFLHKMVVEEL